MLPELRALASYYGTQRSLFPGDELAETIMGELIATQFVQVAERPDGVPVGFVAAVLVPHWMNPAIRTATEVLWWVRPEARHTRAAQLLLEAFVTWGRSSAEWVVLALGVRCPLRERALHRLGFRVAERQYLIEAAP
jgi:hypothetical protein